MSKYSYLNLIKRKAKAHAEARQLPLSKAQEHIAQEAGFAHYHELTVVAKTSPNDSRLMFAAVGLESFDDVLFEDPIWGGIYFLVEDAMNSAISDTNAWDYSIEGLEVSGFTYDDSVGIATLEVYFEFHGEQDEDRPWSGNEFYVDAEILLIYRDGWSLVEDEALKISKVGNDRDRDYADQMAYEKAQAEADDKASGPF